jgi:hypothetical protein
MQLLYAGERMSELKKFAEDQVQKTNKTQRELKVRLKT